MTEGTPKPPPLPQAKPSPGTPPVAGGPPAVPSDLRGESVAGPITSVKAAATKPPIRPVGFRNRDLSTNLVYAATVIQMLVAGLTAIYFYDLRRFDWTTQVTAGDAAFDLTDGFLQRAFPLENLPMDDDERYLESIAKWVQFELLIGWMFYGNLAVGWAELFCFAFWQYRVRRNVAALGSVGLRHSPVLGVVWWIVPFAAMCLPALVIQEIWRASDPSVPPGDGRAWRMKRSSFLIGAWWSVLVLTKLLYWFTGFMLVLGLITIFSPITLQAVALGGTVAAGVLQIELIRRLTRRQASLFQRRTRAVEKAEAAGEPTASAAEGPAV